MPSSKQNQLDPQAPANGLPLLPRRAFLAAGFSAATAALGAGALWMGLLGAPQTETFQFSRGTAFANGEALRLKAHLLPALQDDRIDVVIVGHTGQQGVSEANLDLSKARAAAAANLAVELGLPRARLTVRGVGAARPLTRADGQSERAFQSSLARVEVTLQARR